MAQINKGSDVQEATVSANSVLQTMAPSLWLECSRPCMQFFDDFLQPHSRPSSGCRMDFVRFAGQIPASVTESLGAHILDRSKQGKGSCFLDELNRLQRVWQDDVRSVALWTVAHSCPEKTKTP